MGLWNPNEKYGIGRNCGGAHANRKNRGRRGLIFSFVTTREHEREGVVKINWQKGARRDIVRKRDGYSLYFFP